MNSFSKNERFGVVPGVKGGRVEPSHDDAQEIVRALRGGEIDAVVIEEHGQHQVMALASLTNLDEITELVRALRNGEVDAFVTEEGDEGQLYAVTPIHEVLSQQYHLTKAITDNATTGLFIIDEHQQCVFMNPAAETLTGFTLSDMRGRAGTFHDIVHHVSIESSHAVPACPVKTAFLSATQTKGEAVFVHKDGHFYDVAYSASPVHDASGQMYGTIIEIRDITKQLKMQKALVRADRRKDDFIATLAHELRNPLAPISNLVALMKQSDCDAEFVRQASDTIDRQLSKIVRLVDDLLDVSRITRNTIELRRETVELSAVIGDACETCRPLIEQLGHELRVDMPHEAVYLNADGARLSQVFGNLIQNACKFTLPGGQIEIRAECDNGEVVVGVKDNGIGIAPGELAGVFEMFSQRPNPPGGMFGGLGIGLSLSKRFVKMHGGTIEARSQGAWTGSEFIVRLPVTHTATEPRSTPVESPAPKGLRILVVDDNVDSAESMAALLEHTGNVCCLAHDAQVAIELAGTFTPDVVLLDIGLPGMDGYAACRAIREQPWSAGAKIIAMTGWGQEEDRRRSADAGFDGHLVKPVEIGKLYEMIETSRP